MLSVEEIHQNSQIHYSWDYQFEYLINKKLRSHNISSLDQVFMGDTISLRSAIVEKTRLHCFLDFGRFYDNDFLLVGSISFNWKPEKNECHIGLLWIEPKFRGNGLATQILKEIIDYADELGIILTVHAIPFIDSEKEPKKAEILRLKKLYANLGFFSDKSKDRSKIGRKKVNYFMKRLPIC